MVNISINVTDLGGEAHPGDKVIFWRPRVGGSATHAGRVISTAPHTVVLEDGTATVPDVEPGEMRVLLQCRGFESQEPIPVVVPDGTGVVTLRALVESQFEYSPPIVSAVQQAADNAAASERNSKTSEIRARQHADRAESIVDDAIANGAEMVRDEVKQDADRAVAARQAVESAKGVTETARDEAVAAAGNAVADIHDELDSLVTSADGHANRAATAAGTAASDAVAQVRGELDALVEDASQSKTAAATSETNAAQSEADASGYAEIAEQYKNAAGVHESNAAQSKANAAQSETNAATSEQAADAHRSMASQWETSAATHAGNALAHAERSEDARDESRLARDEAVQAAENAQQGAPSGGWKKSEFTQSVQDSLSRADTAMQSIPVATPSAPGAIRLSGDLSGTSQAPTVPGLADKANVSHTHESGDVVGLEDELQALRDLIHARHAFFSGEGAPVDLPYAVVGDYYFDESTEELHKITGV